MPRTFRVLASRRDRGLADFDIRNVFHFSGGYALPFGHGKKFMDGGGGIANGLLEDGA